jgi:hypothetical protein
LGDHEPFAGLSQELTQETVALLLSSIRNVMESFTADQFGRLRVSAEALATLANVTTVATVTTVGTVSTLTNQTNIGGLSAAPQIIALTQMSEDNLRTRI